MPPQSPEYQKIWLDVQKAFSRSRITPFVQPADVDEIDALARYYWNMALSEALYPVLSSLEVVLRNAIHDALTRAKKQADWYDIPGLLRPSELAKAAAAKEELTRRQKLHTPDRIVAELNFGFWTSLFVHHYDQSIVIPVLPRAFPSLSPKTRTRRIVAPILDDIRLLRNRVFHHEPIWYWRDLSVKHGKALDVIGWISPTTRQIITTIDRFQDVSQRGWRFYRDEIEFKILEAQDTPQ